MRQNTVGEIKQHHVKPRDFHRRCVQKDFFCNHLLQSTLTTELCCAALSRAC